MANRKKSHESCRDPSKSSEHLVTDVAPFLSSSSSDEEVTPGCRGCRNSSPEHSARNRVGVEQRTGQDASRREHNPMSFIGFLKNETQTNYHNTGARPKVYVSPRLNAGSLEKETGGVYSRNPTELPDFVQDHLVIEQCYLNHESAQQILPDVDNLPDFALNSMEQRQSRLRNEGNRNESNERNLACDLTGAAHRRMPHRDQLISNAVHPNHLNLPTYVRSMAEPVHRPESTSFPLDLPLPIPESNSNMNIIARDGQSGGEISIHKSLPDFLSDGPIHNRTALSVDTETTSNMTESSTERRLLLENERLRHGLEIARRHINEKTERICTLELELSSRREVELEDAAHLEKVMEQVEDNLERSTKRAVDAEITVTSLKKEIKALTTEISLLRLQNSELQARIMAAGQSESNAATVQMNRTIKRLARDLFSAASTAETSLRQLMSGVNNLRVLASTLENVDRIEDWTKDFLPDFDEDNAAGPVV